MSRYIVGLLEQIGEHGEPPCSRSLAWAASLPESTSAREAWDAAGESWQDWVAGAIDAEYCQWSSVRDRLCDLGIEVPDPVTSLHEARAFLLVLRGEEPVAPLHSSTPWTLAALGIAAP